MLVPNRNFPTNTIANGGYRYGFQGQEKDDDIKNKKGTSLNYKFRMHDSRVGWFFAVDPLTAKYPWNSSYAFSENNTIRYVELEGLEKGDPFTLNNFNENFDFKPSLKGRITGGEAKLKLGKFFEGGASFSVAEGSFDLSEGDFNGKIITGSIIFKPKLSKAVADQINVDVKASAIDFNLTNMYSAASDDFNVRGDFTAISGSADLKISKINFKGGGNVLHIDENGDLTVFNSDKASVGVDLTTEDTSYKNRNKKKYKQLNKDKTKKNLKASSDYKFSYTIGISIFKVTLE